MRRPSPTGWKVRTLRRGAGAFTLFEILVVLGILSIVITIGVPTIFHAVQKSPLRQAMSDLEEGCRHARMMAIMQGTPAELVINAVDGTITARPASETAGQPREEPIAVEPTDPTVVEDRPASARASSIPNFSAKLPDSVAFKRLVVNLQDMMDYTEARIRFYPNGTSDALTATLLSEQNEERTLTLEITTARENVEVTR